MDPLRAHAPDPTRWTAPSRAVIAPRVPCAEPGAPSALQALGGDPTRLPSDGQAALPVIGRQAEAAARIQGPSAEASRFLVSASAPAPRPGGASLEGVERYLARPSESELVGAHDDVTARMRGEWGQETARAVAGRVASLPQDARGQVLADAARDVATFASRPDLDARGIRTVGEMAPVLGTADPDQAQASQRVLQGLGQRLREGDPAVRGASVEALGAIAGAGDETLGRQAARTILAGPGEALAAGLRGEIPGADPVRWAQQARDPALTNRLLDVARGLGPEHLQRLEAAGLQRQELPAHPVDRFLGGVADGVRETVDTVEALATRPGETLSGMAAGLARAAQDPLGTARAVVDGVRQAFEEDPWRAAGRAAFEVGSNLVGGAGAARRAVRAGDLAEAAGARAARELPEAAGTRAARELPEAAGAPSARELPGAPGPGFRRQEPVGDGPGAWVREEPAREVPGGGRSWSVVPFEHVHDDGLVQRGTRIADARDPGREGFATYRADADGRHVHIDLVRGIRGEPGAGEAVVASILERHPHATVSADLKDVNRRRLLEVVGEQGLSGGPPGLERLQERVPMMRFRGYDYSLDVDNTGMIRLQMRRNADGHSTLTLSPQSESRLFGQALMEP